MPQAVYNHTDNRQITTVLNEVVRILDSATGSVNLANTATTTTVSNPKVTTSSRIFLQPRNAAAAGSGAFISTISNGSFVIGHASAATVRTFDYLVYSA